MSKLAEFFIIVIGIIVVSWTLAWVVDKHKPCDYFKHNSVQITLLPSRCIGELTK